jgi:NTP pyrophosphatase (non-canonical NTP hydrolase)
MSQSGDLQNISLALHEFAIERDWEQFHSPKNLAMALSAEAGELIEQFQWLTEEQSSNLDDKRLNAIRDEVADVFIYLIKLADKLDIDLLEAARHKIDINHEKYPVDKVKGSSRKYTEYERD